MSESKHHTIKGCGILSCLILLFGTPLIFLLKVSDININIKELPIVKNIFLDRKEYDYNFQIQPGEDEILTQEQKDIAKNSIQVGSTKVAKAVFLKVVSAEIEGPIVYGQDGDEMMRQGFWHFPGTVMPGEKGTSVLFGHRRYHVPPDKDTFYNLDKIQVGDIMEVQLEDNTWLTYKVISTVVVQPDDFAILQSGLDYHLKLVTCTPLGSWTHRLVVTGELIN